MSKPYKDFEPSWVKTAAPKDSWRSVFRWGDPNFVKYPKESLYKMMKEKFQMTDEDFKDYDGSIGMEEVKLENCPVNLDEKHIDVLRKIVGEEYVRTDDYARVSVAYGKTAYDAMRLREKRMDSLPDVVVYPAKTKEVEEIVAYCTKEKIPLYVYGGGSSVTMGVEPTKGGISLDMRLRFNHVVSFNETDQTDHSPGWNVRSKTGKSVEQCSAAFRRKAGIYMRTFSSVFRVQQRRRLGCDTWRRSEQYILRMYHRHCIVSKICDADRKCADQSLSKRGNRPESESDYDGK